MIRLIGKVYWLVMKVFECLLVNLSVGDLLGMKKGEVVFEVHFAKETRLQKVFAVVGMFFIKYLVMGLE